MQKYIGRIVVLLTPVFAGVSGALVSWVANNLPGAPSLDATELTALFVAGAGLALGAVVKWLDGLQKHEARREVAYPVQELAPVTAAKTPARRKKAAA